MRALVLAWLLIGGCTAARQALQLPGVPSSSSAEAAAPQIAQQAGQMNLAAQWGYHSELPWKAVLLLTAYVGLEAIKQSWIVYLSHRREIVRLRQSDRPPRFAEVRL